MTSGWGVDATLNGSGVPTSGTTDDDVRKVWGALYTPGIISGCTVTTSPSSMTYTVASGVVAVKTADGERVMAPVQGQAVTTAPAPSSGSRVDIIYAQQRYPDVEGDSNVVLGVAETLPSRAVAIKKFTVAAGKTNTDSVVQYTGVDYSIPYGATLGELAYYQYTSTGSSGLLPNSLTRIGTKSWSIPTDRRIKFKVQACISANAAAGFDASKYCEYGFLPNIDGGDMCLFSTPGLHQAWQTVYFERTITVLAGEHTSNLGIIRLVGPGQALGHYGTGPDGFGRNGIEFFVEDAGPVK